MKRTELEEDVVYAVNTHRILVQPGTRSLVRWTPVWPLLPVRTVGKFSTDRARSLIPGLRLNDDGTVSDALDVTARQIVCTWERHEQFAELARLVALQDQDKTERLRRQRLSMIRDIREALGDDAERLVPSWVFGNMASGQITLEQMRLAVLTAERMGRLRAS